MKKLFAFLALFTMVMGANAWVVSGAGAILNGETWNHTSEKNTMIKQDDGSYKLVVSDAVLEIGATYDWLVTDGKNWIKDGDNNYKITVAETAKYEIVYTLDADEKAASAEVKKTGDAGDISHTYNVAGTPATVFGSAWNEKSTATDMQLGSDGVYRWKAEGIALGEGTKIEFKVVEDHAWGQAFPASNKVVTIEENGTYDLTFTFVATTKDVDCIVEKKGSADIETVYIVAGSSEELFGTAWDGTVEANKMEKGADGIYTKTYTEVVLPAGDIQWKIVQNGSSWIPAGEGNNNHFSIPEDGKYDVTFSYDVAKEEMTASAEKKGDAVITTTYIVAGSSVTLFGTAWDGTVEANKMEKGADGIYTKTYADVEFSAGDAIEWKVVKDGETWIPDGDNNVISITEDGIYDITFTFNASTKDMSGNANLKTAIVTTYVVVGSSETLFGTAWDGTAEANKMEKNEKGVWEKTYADVNLNAGAIEWKVVKNGSKWIPDGEGNNLTITVPESGVYTVTFSYAGGYAMPQGKLYKDGKEIIPEPSTCEGWPANYGGVMLQAFYWDSYEDTTWGNLMKQADDLCKYFDLIWVPNSGNCGSKGMGYLPIYWFNHTSNWGRERYLLSMISAFKEKGSKVIMDVVINHKAPIGDNGSWVDFANESKKVTLSDGSEKTYSVNWTTADICRNDDGGYTNEVGKLMGWEVTGNDDTGDDFSGGRDLDHTSLNVQNNVKTYLDFLRKYIGYDGFRLDMVKGYSPYYTKMYNEYSKPEFCVGEYWDGSFDNVTGWIQGTGWTSAAFDFPLKYVIRDAFGNENWSALNSKGIAGSPDWQRYSVTFIDNHDTYENQDRLTKNVLAAYSFILSMPGTPCVFLKHWQKYPIALGNMILARKACGVTNQSTIVEQGEQNGGYVIKTQGSNGTMLCISGNVQDYDASGFTKIVSGTNYALYVSDNVKVEGLQEGNDIIDFTKTVNIYVEAETAPHLYSWTEGGEQRSGEWPGMTMTEQETIKEKTFWKYTFNMAPINLILNDGNGHQTAALNDLSHDTYLSYDGGTNYTDITAAYWTPEVPPCVKVIDGHLYAYFRANKDYDTPYAWVWNDNKNFCTNSTFPGDPMELVGFDADNYPVFCWDGGTIGENDEMPTKILISNIGSETIRTAELDFKNANYYDATGYIGNALISTNAVENIIVETEGRMMSQWFNLNGQRVTQPTKGLYIHNGRKLVVK